MHEGSSNKLETEQEREQEQEQQKEVKARRDQQVEIEKFVDREYSRNEESPTPWPLQALLRPPPGAAAPVTASLASQGNNKGDDEGSSSSLAAAVAGGGAYTAAESSSNDHPFYPLREFRLRHQESLNLPPNTPISRNYFNPDWSGLRPHKNLVMVMEWAPAADDPASLRLFTGALQAIDAGRRQAAGPARRLAAGRRKALSRESWPAP